MPPTLTGTLERRLNQKQPQVDPVTIGISFIDILFALAIAVVLMPIQSWARDSSSPANSLPSANVVNLSVALVLILGSFVGYHNSTNRPKFRIRFVNVEFLKFSLDICMVMLYFVVAAFAANRPVDLRAETVAIAIAFLLYLLWDLASLYQKSQPQYKTAWCNAYCLSDRPTLMEDWSPADTRRIHPTIAGLIVCTLLCLYVWMTSSVVNPRSTYIVDSVLIALLFGYRVWKDSYGSQTSDGCPDCPEPVKT